MKYFLTLALAFGALTFGALARAEAPTLKFELQTGVSLLQGYTLDGVARPPAVGYQIGTTVFHVKVNGSLYDLSAEGAGILWFGGTLSAGLLGCVAPHDGGWMGGALCVGAAGDVYSAATGRSMVQGRWRWDASLPLLASAGLHF